MLTSDLEESAVKAFLADWPNVLDLVTQEAEVIPGLNTVFDDKRDWNVSACHFMAERSKLDFACIGLKYADILQLLTLNGIDEQ